MELEQPEKNQVETLMLISGFTGEQWKVDTSVSGTEPRTQTRPSRVGGKAGQEAGQGQVDLGKRPDRRSLCCSYT